MIANASRYPGVQPFTDNRLASSTFFGRQQEIDLLKAQVISNRLTVVYARSGIGKTSLLNAGLHQTLRDEGFLPLMLRINDRDKSVVDCVLDPLTELAERQTVEIVEGSRRSLWHYFKTVEFWNKDVLLNPVLILDQFEELFTLRDISDQTKLLQELGHLVRGDVPCGEGEQLSDSLLLTEREQELTMTAPIIHVILSLREDYLGLLDEASDYMPTILSNRFRLRPLNMAAAHEALSAPSQLSDAAFVSHKFTIDTVLENVILSFLADEAPKIALRGEQIDPFQLQLICQRVEEHVIRRQQQDPSYQLVTLEDMGGREALKMAMRNFYARITSHCCDDIRSYVGIFRRYLIKKRVNNLCTKQLISPEGRRLSIDEASILNRFRIPHQVLANLVRARLLRSDQRAGNTYYELSHDTLAEEIRNKPLTINIRLQQFLLALPLASLVFLTFVLLCCLVYSGVGVFNYEWVNTELKTNNKATDYLVFVFIFLLGTLLSYQALVRCLRGIKHLNRRLRPHAQRSATLQLQSIKREPEPFSLMVDAALQTIVLLKDWRILAMLVLITLPVNILLTKADLRTTNLLGYSYVDYPHFFLLSSVADLLTFVIVAYAQQRSFARSVRPAVPYPSLKSVTIATLRTYPLTGMWLMLLDLFRNPSIELRQNGLWLAFLIIGAISCVISYRYLYLGYHYALKPIRLASAVVEAPHLLSYNRWTVLIASASVIFIAAFVDYVAGNILNGLAPSVYTIYLTFATYLSTTFMLLWLYVTIFLGYSEARESGSV